MPETLVLMQLDTLLETCLRQIKFATYFDRYVGAKIPKDMMFQRTLDSEWELCSVSVGFRTYILFDICWIPRTNSVLHLLDSAQKFFSVSVGFRAEIVLYLLNSAQKL